MILLVMLFSCEDIGGEKVSKKLLKEKEIYNAYIEDVHLIYTNKGKIKLEVKAPKLYVYTTQGKERKEFKEGGEFFIFSNSGKVNNYMRANHAIHYESKDIVEARGDVVVYNSKGDTLRSEFLKWNRKTRKIWSNQLTRISSPTQNLIGRGGFEADDQLDSYTLKSTKGKIKIKDNE